jgi:hypothetical protein
MRKKLLNTFAYEVRHRKNKKLLHKACFSTENNDVSTVNIIMISIMQLVLHVTMVKKQRQAMAEGNTCASSEGRGKQLRVLHFAFSFV